MISVSDAFRTAVNNGAPQRALLEFVNGAYVTNEDISITSGGLHYDEVINGETELTIGACPSARISVALVNTDGWLTNFSFGQFAARLGVQTTSSAYTLTGNVQVEDSDGNIISGHEYPPYLRINGVGVDEQPAFPIRAMVLDAYTLYFFGPTGERGSGEWWDGTYTDLGEPFIRSNAERKIPSLVRGSRGLVLDGDTHIEYTGGVRTVWEYAPLGVFTALRPEVVRTNVVTVEAQDAMSKFDVPMPDLTDDDFPMTIGDLLKRLKSEMNVRLATTTFLNSDVVIPEKPAAFADATAREVLGWIAQAACSYARFSRTYALELVWFSETDRVLTAANYSEFTPCEYEVAPVMKVQVRNADSDEETVIGDGDNAYLIQDNPLLKASETAALSDSSPAGLIYDRLSSFPAFKPVSASTFADWSLQSGDVIQVVSRDGTSYRVPIYSLSLDWQGGTKVNIENSGGATRPPVPKQQRQNFNLGRGSYAARKKAEEIQTWAQVQIDEQAALITMMAGRVDEVEEDYSAAMVRINGLDAEIDMKVAKNGVIAAINMSAENGILIQAEKIDLQGYTTMDQLEAISAELNMITTGLSIVELLTADAIYVDDLEAVKATISGLTIPAGGTSVIGGTVGFLSGSKTTFPSGSELVIASNCDLKIFGYKPKWNQMTVATGALTVLPEIHRYNFAMADGTSKMISVMTGIEITAAKDTITYLYRGERAQ